MWKLGEWNAPRVVSDSTLSQVPQCSTPSGKALLALWLDPSPYVSASSLDSTDLPKNAHCDYVSDYTPDSFSVGIDAFLCTDRTSHLDALYKDPDGYLYGLCNYYPYIRPFLFFCLIPGGCQYVQFTPNLHDVCL